MSWEVFFFLGWGGEGEGFGFMKKGNCIYIRKKYDKEKKLKIKMKRDRWVVVLS